MVPIFIGDEMQTVMLWNLLYEAGVFVNVAILPAVPYSWRAVAHQRDDNPRPGHAGPGAVDLRRCQEDVRDPPRTSSRSQALEGWDADASRLGQPCQRRSEGVAGVAEGGTELRAGLPVVH